MKFIALLFILALSVFIPTPGMAQTPNYPIIQEITRYANGFCLNETVQVVPVNGTVLHVRIGPTGPCNDSGSG
ncbi:hypothetical protein CAEBREN_18403 [Caenorhabditis brenneri]|uniref:Uncharacterized protein n=1 Tax=Caenorhabditis brenneri TaxID=135651 RepID=G0MJ83_CAEBE|nr:hypothetical protein CAEBREN_18403 [Caenorhabditis brenneri]